MIAFDISEVVERFPGFRVGMVIAALLAEFWSAQTTWEVFDAHKLTGRLDLPSPVAGADAGVSEA